MHLDMKTAETELAAKLTRLGLNDARDIAWATVWLEACGYSGIKLLAEALADPQRRLICTLRDRRRLSVIA